MVLTVIAEGSAGGQTLTEWFRLSLKNKIKAISLRNYGEIM